MFLVFGYHHYRIFKKKKTVSNGQNKKLAFFSYNNNKMVANTSPAIASKTPLRNILVLGLKIKREEIAKNNSNMP